MARMIPDYVHSDCLSNAERKIFHRLKEELPNSYVVLHSLALAKHSRKLRSEIDFVIINERGVLCIEVKGGRIRAEKGVWCFTDRYGDMHLKRESPFEQASSNMFALKRSVESRFGKKAVQSSAIFGFFVVFPDIYFAQESPEWDLNCVIDNQGLNTDAKTLIDRQYEYSEYSTRRIRPQIPLPIMSESEKDELVNYLRGDFDFIPSLRQSIEQSYQELLRLTEEQYCVLDQLEENPRIIVHGKAGTGKTVLGIERIRREARRGKRVAYFCFNRLLSKKIRNLLEKEHLGGSVEVATLHSYANKIIEAAGLKTSEEETLDDGYFRRVYPKLFFDALLSTMSAPPFEYLVVDEGQDLKYKVYLDMLDRILIGGFSLGRWLWMEDDQQNLFNLNRERLDADLMQYSPTVCYLTKNCRNTLPISTFASLVSGFGPQECLLRVGPEVKIFFFKDMEDEFEEVEKEVNKLIGEGLSYDDIVILIPVSLEKSSLQKRKSIAGLSLMPYDPTAPSPRSIRYCTIQSFKGLESKALIVTDILDLDADYSRYVNYVGLSRAMSWLSIMISEKAKGQYSEKVKEYAEKLSAGLGRA
jgi:hypothetical protein